LPRLIVSGEISPPSFGHHPVVHFRSTRCYAP
jgi:hypothetical protein